MLGRTHMLGGLIFAGAGLMVMQSTTPEEMGIAMAAGVYGSLLPDIDQPNSYISRHTLIHGAISRAIAGTPWGKHRRLLHTPFMAAILSLTLFLIMIPVQMTWGISAMLAGVFLFLGMLSHLVLDSMNPQGVPWMYPVKRDLKKKQRFPWTFQTDSTPEVIFRCLLILVTGVMYMNLLSGSLVESLRGMI